MDEKRAGITLVELMIALAIVAVALLALMSLLFSSSTLQQTGREKVIAYNAARKIIEDMRNTNYVEIFYRFNADPNDNFDRLGQPLSWPCPGGSLTPGFETIDKYYKDAIQGLNPSYDGAGNPVPILQVIFPTRVSDGLFVEELDWTTETGDDLQWFREEWIDDKVQNKPDVVKAENKHIYDLLGLPKDLDADGLPGKDLNGDGNPDRDSLGDVDPRPYLAPDGTTTSNLKIIPVLIRVKWQSQGQKGTKSTSIDVSSLITDK